MRHDRTWHKSSYSGGEGDNCVETAVTPSDIRVRDSKDTTRNPLRFRVASWTAFTTHLGEPTPLPTH